MSKPLILTVHSTEFDRTGQLYPNQQIAEIEKTGLLEADKIITVSKLVKKQIVEKYGIQENKITVVYNAIDLKHYKKENVKRPLDEQIVLFVGRLTVQKGCEFFLEAAKKVLSEEPNTRFLIVGTGDLLHDMIQKSIDVFHKLIRFKTLLANHHMNITTRIIAEFNLTCYKFLDRANNIRSHRPVLR